MSWWWFIFDTGLAYMTSDLCENVDRPCSCRAEVMGGVWLDVTVGCCLNHVFHFLLGRPTCLISSEYVSLHLLIYKSVYPSFFLYIYLSACLPACQPACLFVCLMVSVVWSSAVPSYGLPVQCDQLPAPGLRHQLLCDFRLHRLELQFLWLLWRLWNMYV